MTQLKVSTNDAAHGELGQKYLVTGEHIALRLWENEQPGAPKEAVARPYETVGYVLQGRAELILEGQTLPLEPGDSWVVPHQAVHSYRILEAFTAVEATHPPAHQAQADAQSIQVQA